MSIPNLNLEQERVLADDVEYVNFVNSPVLEYLETCLKNSAIEDVKFHEFIAKIALIEKISFHEVRNNLKVLLNKFDELTTLVSEIENSRNKLKNFKNLDLKNFLFEDSSSLDDFWLCYISTLELLCKHHIVLKDIVDSFWNYFPSKIQASFLRLACVLYKSIRPEQGDAVNSSAKKDSNESLTNSLQFFAEGTDSSNKKSGQLIKKLVACIKYFFIPSTEVSTDKFLESYQNSREAYINSKEAYVNSVFKRIPIAQDLLKSYSCVSLPVLLYCILVYSNQNLPVEEIYYQNSDNSVNIFTVLNNSLRSNRDFLYDCEWDIGRAFPEISFGFTIVEVADCLDTNFVFSNLPTTSIKYPYAK